MTLPFAISNVCTLYEAGQLRSTTAGLAGGVSRRSARGPERGAFAPYARGFAGIGKPIPARRLGPSPTLSEAQALMALGSNSRPRKSDSRAALESRRRSGAPRANASASVG
jgi:hypothetical protein